MAERFRQMSEDFERKGLSEPFKGITSNGHLVPDLFEIPQAASQPSPSEMPPRNSLVPSRMCSSPGPCSLLTISNGAKWMNQHFYARQGISLQEMTDSQRDAAFDLMRASLSAKGFELTRNIMRLNETLAELTNDHDFLGEWRYYITVMGKPSASKPWGWQLDGYHAIINYFVLGDQVVMTPHFIGSEPVSATSGMYKGLEILQQEQNDGLQMLQALPEEQRRKATVTSQRQVVTTWPRRSKTTSFSITLVCARPIWPIRHVAG
jgi:hypothetical protein